MKDFVVVLRQSLVVVLVLMLGIAVLMFWITFQQFKHLHYGGLKSFTQVLAAVGFSKRRHMDEGGVTLAQVQRGVVGVVTQVPARGAKGQMWGCVKSVLHIYASLGSFKKQG